MPASRARPDRGVQVDGLALDRRERAGLRQDRLGHVELTDVVHQAAPVHLADLRLRQPGELGDLHRELRHAPRVGEGVRSAPLQLGHDE